MRFRTMLAMATLFCACVALAARAEPPSSRMWNEGYNAATQNGSVSGRISSVGDASFSVDVKESKDLVTLRFLIDDKTKIEGKLEVGSIVTVDYRTADAHNVATHVVVQSTHHLHS